MYSYSGIGPIERTLKNILYEQIRNLPRQICHKILLDNLSYLLSCIVFSILESLALGKRLRVHNDLEFNKPIPDSAKLLENIKFTRRCRHLLYTRPRPLDPIAAVNSLSFNVAVIPHYCLKRGKIINAFLSYDTQKDGLTILPLFFLLKLAEILSLDN